MTFDDRIRDRIDTYIKDKKQSVNWFIHIYRNKYKVHYNEEASKEGTIRKLVSDNEHIFTEKEATVISEILKDSNVLIDYLKIQELSYKSKIEEAKRNIENSTNISKQVTTHINNKDLITRGILEEYIQRYIFADVDSPLLILCDNWQYVAYVLKEIDASFRVFTKSETEQDLIDCFDNLLYAGIKCSPENLTVGRMISSASRIIRGAASFHHIKHVVLLVQWKDEQAIKSIFEKYGSLPWKIEFHMDEQQKLKWENIRKQKETDAEKSCKQEDKKIQEQYNDELQIVKEYVKRNGKTAKGYDKCDKKAYLYALRCVPDILNSSSYWSENFKREVLAWLEHGNVINIPYMRNTDWIKFLYKQYNIHKEYLDLLTNECDTYHKVWEEFCKEGFPANWFDEDCKNLSIIRLYKVWQESKDKFKNLDVDKNISSGGKRDNCFWLERDVNNILTGKVDAHDLSEKEWEDWLNEHYLYHLTPFDFDFNIE